MEHNWFTKYLNQPEKVIFTLDTDDVAAVNMNNIDFLECTSHDDNTYCLKGLDKLDKFRSVHMRCSLNDPEAFAKAFFKVSFDDR